MSCLCIISVATEKIQVKVVTSLPDGKIIFLVQPLASHEEQRVFTFTQVTPHTNKASGISEWLGVVDETKRQSPISRGIVKGNMHAQKLGMRRK